MAGMSTFGSDPDRLQRLLSFGLEADTQSRDSHGPDPLDILLDKPGARIGRYEILKVIGEGGMGVVYLAQQQKPIERKVALKVIKPGMDSRRVIARFNAEQQALAMMDHPNVARVYDGGLTTSGRPYFVMEYVAGTPITEYCDQHRLTIDQRLNLFLRVCDAVQHAHEKGIIHRDLKPSNIMVTGSDDQPSPKVIDFGVARALTRSLSEQTLTSEPVQVIGTPQYMPPEQANLGGQGIDIRSDIYSLGVVLYRLLCGLLPHKEHLLKEGEIDAIRKAFCEYDPQPPSARLADITGRSSLDAGLWQTNTQTLKRRLSGDLDWITLKAIEKDKSRRYATVNAFASDIRRYLANEPVRAAPPDLYYRTRKFLRRHRLVVGAATATVATIVGIVLAAAMYNQARDARLASELIEHNRILTEAQTLFDNRQYEPARLKLEAIINSRHVDRTARLLHAKAVQELQGPTAAVEELESLLEPADEIAGEAHFLLAKTYNEIALSNESEATKKLRKMDYHRGEAEKLVPEIARYYFLRRQISLSSREKLNLLRESLKLEPDNIFASPVNAGPVVNSSNSEITPSISADDLTMYFASDRPGGHGDYDIWMVGRSSRDEQWSEPVNLGEPVNTADFEGFQCVSADGRELYFTRGRTNHGDIYMATRNSPDESWQTPRKLPVSINSETGQDWGPLVSFDGLTLYWISNRPDGYGNMDIWFVTRSIPHGQWTGCPEPLAPPVNGPNLEDRKCLSTDELILFFQRPNVGESLYVSIRQSQTDPWSRPIDLGPVLDGSKMSFITSLSSDGTAIYFCDHPWTEPRPGGFGREDIWYLPIITSPPTGDD